MFPDRGRNWLSVNSVSTSSGARETTHQESGPEHVCVRVTKDCGSFVHSDCTFGCLSPPFLKNCNSLEDDIMHMSDTPKLKCHRGIRTCC